MAGGLIGRRVRGAVHGGMAEGEVIALTASESGCSLFMWIVDRDDGALRRIATDGRGETVVLPRDVEGPLR